MRLRLLFVDDDELIVQCDRWRIEGPLLITYRVGGYRGQYDLQQFVLANLYSFKDLDS